MSLSRGVRFRTALRCATLPLILAALLLLQGCWVESINPLYEEGTWDNPVKDHDVLYDPTLVGSWIEIGDNCEATLTIAAKDEVYDLQSTDESEGCAASDKTSHYQARLVKLDNYYFLDFSPMDEEVCARCLAKHDIYLAKFDKSTLSITPIDSDWLKKALAAKKIALATLGDDPDTITASSKDLKAFCRKFAGNKRVFKPQEGVQARSDAHVPAKVGSQSAEFTL